MDLLWREGFSMITLENLSKWRGEHLLFKDVSLTIHPGNIIGLTGPSGSGKTTLLRCLAGLEKPDFGHFHGDVKVGVVFQGFHLFPHMTVFENILYTPLKILKMPRDEAESKAMALLKKLDLLSKKDVYPKKLSGGQQQRVAIARVLMSGASVILMDEPTSALDSKNIERISALIKELSMEKIAFLIVSHDRDFLKSVTDKIYLLEEGLLYPKE